MEIAHAFDTLWLLRASKAQQIAKLRTPLLHKPCIQSKQYCEAGFSRLISFNLVDMSNACSENIQPHACCLSNKFALFTCLACSANLSHDNNNSASVALSQLCHVTYFADILSSPSSSLDLVLKTVLHSIHTQEPLSCLLENVNFWALPSCKNM